MIVYWFLAAVLALLLGAFGRRVREWPPHRIVFAPTLLLLLGVSWGDDALGPVTPLAYLVPSALAWAAGFLVGPKARRFLREQADE